jgi:hypothetical protein
MIPIRLKDPVLKINPHYYSVCVVTRILIGISFLVTNKSSSVFSLLVILGFLYKLWKNPNSWKNYTRTIMIYSICLILSEYFKEKRYICGVFIILDALMGQQLFYIASNYLN